MSVDNFIPTLWSTKFIDRLKKEHVYANCVNRDYEGEIKNFGDTIRVNTVGPVTISAYTKNTINLTPEVIQGAGQPMTIDQADYFYFAIDDVDKAQTNGAVMEGAMEESAYGMRDTTDSFLATTIAASIATANILEVTGGSDSSTTNPIYVGTGAGDENAFDLLVKITTRLNIANVPSGNRWCVIDPTFVEKLLLDPRFTSFATQMSSDVIKAGSSAGGMGGMLPSIFKVLTGMDIYVSNNVPNTSSVYTILAGYKGAVSYAEQIAEGNPEAFRLQTGFADAVRGLHLYGAKVFRPSALAAAYVQYNP